MRDATWSDLMLVMRGSGLVQFYCSLCGCRAAYSVVLDVFACRGCENHVQRKTIVEGFRQDAGFTRSDRIPAPRFQTGPKK